LWLVLGSRRVESIFGSANNCIHRELSSPRRGGGWPNGHEVSRSANLSGRTSVLYIMYYLSILEFPSRLFLFLSPNKWISGGHGIFSGASGIGEGLTIDLLQLKGHCICWSNPNLRWARKQMDWCRQCLGAKRTCSYWRSSGRYWRRRVNSWWWNVILFWKIWLGMWQCQRV
jgi:hypothetical protein